MKPPRLVIFDCDGVLVDSEPLSNRVLAELLSACGLPTSTEQAYALYKGQIMPEVIRISEERLGAALPADFVARHEAARDAVFRQTLQAVPGAAEAIAALSAAGTAVCVASQGKREKTELTLGLTGLRDLFGPNALFTAYEVPRGKPFPDLFLHAAASMGVDPAETVVVEDTPIGTRAGVAAAMRVLSYAADSDPDALRAVGGEPYHDHAELPGLLGLPA